MYSCFLLFWKVSITAVLFRLNFSFLYADSHMLWYVFISYKARLALMCRRPVGTHDGVFHKDDLLLPLLLGGWIGGLSQTLQIFSSQLRLRSRLRLNLNVLSV
jgi:hypothetical protein